MRLEERNGSSAPGLSKWEAAVGNLEDARVAFDVLARAVDDAVYLDEDAYSHVAPTAQYTKVIQVQSWPKGRPGLSPRVAQAGHFWV